MEGRNKRMERKVGVGGIKEIKLQRKLRNGKKESKGEQGKKKTGRKTPGRGKTGWEGMEGKEGIKDREDRKCKGMED